MPLQPTMNFMTIWQSFLALGVIFEKSNSYPGQARRVAQLVGASWLGFAYLGYKINADSESGREVALVVGTFNLLFALAAGPFRRTPINDVEKYLLVPVSFGASLTLLYQLWQ